jgi:hypothetical protein
MLCKISLKDLKMDAKHNIMLGDQNNAPRNFNEYLKCWFC